MIRAKRGLIQSRTQLSILRMVRTGLATWVSSTVLNIEVSRNPDSDGRHDAEELLSFANEVVVPQSVDAVRAKRIEELGFSPFDTLRLASAELGGADVFLTTDDDLLLRGHTSARRFGHTFRVM
jgi:hypothetical protein